MPETSLPVEHLPVEHLFTITANTSLNASIDGPHGTRVIIDASSGSFEGPKLKGTVKGPGGDWVLARPDGSFLLDVRLVLETHDGAAIYMTYRGIAKDSASWIRTAPMFETGDERYAWLNSVQAVATGQSNGTSVTYEVYQLV
jgi:Protein of unknown function (DUF3237)